MQGGEVVLLGAGISVEFTATATTTSSRHEIIKIKFRMPPRLVNAGKLTRREGAPPRWVCSRGMGEAIPRDLSFSIMRHEGGRRELKGRLIKRLEN